MAQMMENRKDVECLMQHISVIAGLMAHLRIHLTEYHDCSLQELVAEISKDLYNHMQKFAPEIAAQVGPPPEYQCTCGLHEGGQIVSA